MSLPFRVTPEEIRRGLLRKRGNLPQNDGADGLPPGWAQNPDAALSDGYDPRLVADAGAQEPALPHGYSLATVGDASVDRSGPSLKDRILRGVSAGVTSLGQTFNAKAGGTEGFLGSLGQGFSNTNDALYGTREEQLAREIRSQALGRQAQQDQGVEDQRRAERAHWQAQDARPQTPHNLDPNAPDVRAARAQDARDLYKYERDNPKAPVSGESPAAARRAREIDRRRRELVRGRWAKDLTGELVLVERPLDPAKALQQATAEYDGLSPQAAVPTVQRGHAATGGGASPAAPATGTAFPTHEARAAWDALAAKHGVAKTTAEIGPRP